MNNDRRKFLSQAGTISIASLFLPGGVLAKIAVGRGKILSRDGFAARTNEWFYLHNADATHHSNLELIGVADEGSSRRIEQFTLTFRSDHQDVALPSEYYAVAGEPFHLFVNHTHEQAGRQFYRAEFSLLRRPLSKSKLQGR